MSYGLPTGIGIRVNTRQYTVNSHVLRVDSAYMFKAFMTDAPGSFSITTPSHTGALFEDAPSYNQPTLPGF